MNAIIVLILRIVMIAILYLFIIWIFVSVWRSLRMLNKTQDISLVPEITFSYQLPEGTSEKSFRSSPISLGRDSDSDFILDHPTVSANHCQIYFKGNQWWLQDNHSTNGTKLNQVAVEEHMVLASGDEIHCGQISLTISIAK